MQMQFEQSDFERGQGLDTEDREAMQREQVKLGLKMAALCKAILDPRYFDNYKFWHFISEKGINEDFLNQANRMAFINGSQPGEECFLGGSSVVDYFARWPHLTEVIFYLKLQLTKQETFQLLFNCYYTRFKNLAFRNQLNQLIELVYQRDYVHCKTFSEEQFTDDKILGLDRTFHTPSASLWLKVLSGFMATLAGGVLLLALTSLPFPAAPVAAVAGVALLAGSYGLFKYTDRTPVVIEEESILQPR